MDLQDLFDRRVDIVFTRRLAVENLNGESSSWDGELRGISKEAGKLRDSQREWQSRQLQAAVLDPQMHSPFQHSWLRKSQ